MLTRINGFAWLWPIGVCSLVLVVSQLPGTGGVIAAMLAATLGGGAAAFWLGNAARRTAEDAIGAAAFVGTGALLGTVAAFALFGVTVGRDSDARWGGLLLGFGFGLINLGVSTLSGLLVWIGVSQPPASTRA
jgi:hypothetical protein